MVDVDVRVSSHLKELTWAVNKRLWVIKNSKSTKELKNKAILKFKTMLYTLLCGP